MRLLLLLLHCLGARGLAPKNLYWNSSNPIFGQGDLVYEVNRDNHPWEYDQVNLICPSGRNTTERHVIYSVTRAEWAGCRLQQPHPRIVAVCDQPDNFMYFTITFRSFSPSPRQMEFKPGESYYLVSTGSPGAPHATEGGWCRTHNMRLVFRVAETGVELAASPPRPALFWSEYWGAGGRPRELQRARSDRGYTEGGSALKLQSGGPAAASAGLLVLLMSVILGLV